MAVNEDRRIPRHSGPSVPVQKVTGEINPRWLSRSSGLGISLDPYLTYETRAALHEMSLKKAKKLIEEQERVIDEYCGLREPEPEPGPMGPPQYPLEQPTFVRHPGAWEAVFPRYTHKEPRMPPFPEHMYE